MTYSIDSGWVVSTTDECTCGMGKSSIYGHEAFCGLEQECPVEEFDSWVKHMVKQAEDRGRAEGAGIQLEIDLGVVREDIQAEAAVGLTADRIAAWVREVDGNHTMGAGALGEALAGKIAEALR